MSTSSSCVKHLVFNSTIGLIKSWSRPHTGRGSIFCADAQVK